MKRTSCLFLLVFAVAACAAEQWRPRSLPGCFNVAGGGAPDPERTFLAGLLALEERGYSIVYADSPKLIEADYVSSYRPNSLRIKWVISIARDASMTVDTVPEYAKVHGKTLQWYDKFSQTAQKLLCRDINWLRWEAQNKGLLAMPGMNGFPARSAPKPGNAQPSAPSAAQPSAPSSGEQQPGGHAPNDAKPSVQQPSGSSPGAAQPTAPSPNDAKPSPSQPAATAPSAPKPGAAQPAAAPTTPPAAGAGSNTPR